jgi:hypothetical protein
MNNNSNNKFQNIPGSGTGNQTAHNVTTGLGAHSMPNGASTTTATGNIPMQPVGHGGQMFSQTGANPNNRVPYQTTIGGVPTNVHSTIGGSLTSSIQGNGQSNQTYSIPVQTIGGTVSVNVPNANHAGNNPSNAASAASSSGPSVSLSATQIEQLQNLIRQFKTLGKRFADSSIPKLIEQQIQLQTSGNHGQGFPDQALSSDPNMMDNLVPNVLPTPTPSSSVPNPALGYHGQGQLPSASNPPLVSGNYNTNRPVPIDSKSNIPPSTYPNYNPPPNSQPTQSQQQSITGQNATNPSAANSSSTLPPTGTQSAGQQGSGSVPQATNQSNPVPAGSTSVPPNPTTPPVSLSWQCFHSLLLYGISKSMGECIAFPPSVSSPLSSQL